MDKIRQDIDFVNSPWKTLRLMDFDLLNSTWERGSYNKN